MIEELKPYNSERIYWAVEQVEREAGDIADLHLDDNLFYIKSEADKVIAEKDKELRHQKHKRCLAMAMWCKKLSHVYALSAYTHRGWKIARYYDEKAELYRKWHKRWLELAEKFKEAK